MRRLRYPRYLSRLNAPPVADEQLALEKTIAYARVWLSILTAIAIVIDPTEPGRFVRLIYTLVAGWTLFNIGTVLWLRWRGVSPTVSRTFHVADIIWPSILTLFTNGPSSAFFPLLVFALIAAGFRWGFEECIITGLCAVAVIETQALLLTATQKSPNALLVGQFEVNRLIIRCSYLITVAFLVGMLGEKEKERRAERVVVLRVLRAVRAERAFAVSLQALLEEFSRIFQAERSYLVAEDLNTQKCFVWHGAATDSPTIEPYFTHLDRPVLPSAAPHTFFLERRQTHAVKTYLEDSRLREVPEPDFPSIPYHNGDIQTLLTSMTDLSPEWRARVVLINAQLGRDRGQELRFAEALMRQGSHAVYGVYLVRRLRQRAGALERARVARELHDGAIQSLISAEMRVDVMRRKAEREDAPMTGDLSDVQELLRREILNLRELMQQMRPVNVGPQQLIDVMADAVDRFRRDTGIAARFVSGITEEISLSPHACRELVRILQEALVNVRKHSTANMVLVTFGSSDDAWKLSVHDNGTGFGYSVALAGDDLLTATRGPQIIRERVHLLGGALTIDSDDGAGSRIDVTLPKGPFAHGEQVIRGTHSHR